APRNEPLPLSLAQQRLWFLDRFEDTGAAYHIPGALRLRGTLDVDALRDTLDRIVQRHEALRTTFAATNGQPVQVVRSAATFTLRHVNLEDTPAVEREQLLGELASHEAHAPFSLDAGPLIRGVLVRLQSDEHVLLVTMHHIVSDGWSIAVLIREVGALYAAFSSRQPDPLPPLPVQYPDYSQWQRQWLSGDTLQRQLSYWSKQLTGSPVLLNLPTDRPRPNVQSYAGGIVSLNIDATLTSHLQALARKHDVTLFMLLLGAWSILLGRLSSQEDVVIGAPVANRQRPELEAMIGLFINTLALRINLSDDPDLATLLARIRQTTLDAYAHQELPFEQVVEAVQPVRSLSHSPLFQVMFTLQNTPHNELHLPGLSLASYPLPRSTSQFDMSLSLEEQAGSLSGTIEYASDLFDHGTVERIATQLTTLLEAMVHDPARTIGSLDLLSADERQQVLHDFNDTACGFEGQHLTLHELVEQHARQTPSATAL
ncbi:condensation domain-containing protein, partial [Burkholderia cepacia]|uniref:condensation domain-containing protein n=1 Tax=Burkholderia cepacia TaxID=292 RepID=UPI000A5F7558